MLTFIFINHQHNDDDGDGAGVLKMDRIRYRKMCLIIVVLIFGIATVDAEIVPSDSPSYEVMAKYGNYTVHFSDFDTSGFAYTNNGFSLSFLPRSISYTDSSGNNSLILGSSQFAELQHTDDFVFYDNPYGLGNQLKYIFNPLIVKEVYVMDSLPSPQNVDDWLTMSSIAVYDDTNIHLNYTDENGEEISWNGMLAKTEELKFYSPSDNFLFKFPLPIAKDALNKTISGHYLIYEERGILHISARFPYSSLVNMTLPIYIDLSLGEGEVSFGKSQYYLGDTLDVWARGYALSDERTLLYNPSNELAAKWDLPAYADGWTSKYTYTANSLGWWKVEFETKPLIGGSWTLKDVNYANVIIAPTPTPTPAPTVTPSPTSTPVPTQPPSNVKGVLYGVIVSTTGEKLDYVIITVDTGETMQSNSGGNYAGSASTGWHYITASLPGYISKTEYIYILPIENFPEGPLQPLTKLEFILEPEFQLLPDLSISWGDISFKKVT